MNKKAKVAIFLVAVMVTLIGFNLMVSPSAVDMFRLGKLNGYQIDVVASAKPGEAAKPVVHINGMP
jgi:hypothetical protein